MRSARLGTGTKKLRTWNVPFQSVNTQDAGTSHKAMNELPMSLFEMVVMLAELVAHIRSLSLKRAFALIECARSLIERGGIVAALVLPEPPTAPQFISATLNFGGLASNVWKSVTVFVSRRVAPPSVEHNGPITFALSLMRRPREII
jgi:hypothetical protein